MLLCWKWSLPACRTEHFVLYLWYNRVKNPKNYQHDTTAFINTVEVFVSVQCIFCWVGWGGGEGGWWWCLRRCFSLNHFCCVTCSVCGVQRVFAIRLKLWHKQQQNTSLITWFKCQAQHFILSSNVSSQPSNIVINLMLTCVVHQ